MGGFLFSVQLMNSADLSQVGQIEDDAYQFPWPLQLFRECLQARYHAVVAVGEDQPSKVRGYALMTSHSDEAEILNLTVDSKFRSQGIGAQLLQHMITQARTDGARQLFLEVRESNASASRIYTRFFFKQVGRRKGYYQGSEDREDALVMERSLDH